MKNHLTTGPTRLQRLVALATVPVAALALSACGGEADDAENSQTSAASSAPAAESSPAGDDAASESTSASASSADASESASSESQPSDGESESASSADASDPASEDAGEDPASSGSATESVEGSLDISTFQDLEGIDKKVDSLSAQEACGYLQGAMANPVSLDTPAAGVTGVQDLAKVAPPEVRGAIHALGAALATAKGPSDPALGQALGQVDEVCMSAL